MSLTVEQAKSGRSKCAATQTTIAEKAWRVGMQVYGSSHGHMQMKWQLPLPFLQNIKVEESNGRANSKATQSKILKGELRVGFVCPGTKQETTNWYRPAEAAPELKPVLALDEASSFDLKSLRGFEDLDEPKQTSLLETLSAAYAGGQRKLVECSDDAEDDDSDEDATGAPSTEFIESVHMSVRTTSPPGVLATSLTSSPSGTTFLPLSWLMRVLTAALK